MFYMSIFFICKHNGVLLKGTMAYKMTNVKLDSKMHNALKRLAKKDFSNVSILIKQAIDKFLHEKGIDWREEDEK